MAPETNSPWWTKTLMVVGPVTLIALGLVYFLTTIVSDERGGHQDDIRMLRENLLLHHNETQVLNRKIEEYMRIQNTLTRQLCVNSARDGDARAACFKD